MTNRERVRRAMHYQSVDKVPVRYYYCPVGYYEHGDKLNDLYATMPGEFEPFRRVPVPVLPASDFDEHGNYHSFRKDEWGTLWEYRIYGITGIPHTHPITCPEEAAVYIPPAGPATSGPEFDTYAASVLQNQADDYYTLGSIGSLYETMIALYGDENVLCDICLDEPEINILADRIMERNMEFVQRGLKAGVDSFTVGDDYGTERALLMNPDLWRKFFKPRWKKLFQPIVDAGKEIHFHSCGHIWSILKDLKDVGVTSIWPQLPAYNMVELAAYCRDLGLAVEIHTDRANTMTYGKPEDVRELVKREFDTFKMDQGGSWFYVEADNGFPFENLVALVETIGEFRK